MATVSLPDRPSLDQLRKQARDLQRAVRAGDAQAAAHAAEHGFAAGPRFPVATAHAVVARHYGFASWPRLVRHLEILEELTREPDTLGELDDPAAEFLRLACLTYGENSMPVPAGCWPTGPRSPGPTSSRRRPRPTPRRSVAGWRQTRHRRGRAVAPTGGRRCSTSPTPATIPTWRSTRCWGPPGRCSTRAPTPETATCGTG